MLRINSGNLYDIEILVSAIWNQVPTGNSPVAKTIVHCACASENDPAKPCGSPVLLLRGQLDTKGRPYFHYAIKKYVQSDRRWRSKDYQFSTSEYDFSTIRVPLELHTKKTGLMLYNKDMEELYQAFMGKAGNIVVYIPVLNRFHFLWRNEVKPWFNDPLRTISLRLHNRIVLRRTSTQVKDLKKERSKLMNKVDNDHSKTGVADKERQTSKSSEKVEKDAAVQGGITQLDKAGEESGMSNKMPQVDKAAKDSKIPDKIKQLEKAADDSGIPNKLQAIEKAAKDSGLSDKIKQLEKAYRDSGIPERMKQLGKAVRDSGIPDKMKDLGNTILTKIKEYPLQENIDKMKTKINEKRKEMENAKKSADEKKDK